MQSYFLKVYVHNFMSLFFTLVLMLVFNFTENNSWYFVCLKFSKANWNRPNSTIPLYNKIYICILEDANDVTAVKHYLKTHSKGIVSHKK